MRKRESKHTTAPATRGYVVIHNTQTQTHTPKAYKCLMHIYCTRTSATGMEAVSWATGGLGYSPQLPASTSMNNEYVYVPYIQKCPALCHLCVCTCVAAACASA